MTVFLGSLIVADIPLTFALATADAAVARGEMRKDQSRPYRRIFASYSHRDPRHCRAHRALRARHRRPLPARRRRPARRRGVNPRLLGMIEEADVFQLFWSTNSMRSRYVRQEWEYALSLGRREFVRPTYWRTRCRRWRVCRRRNCVASTSRKSPRPGLEVRCG
ncbi:MAG: TIR domain-containing protein [Verrucomicrobiota bacterium]